MTAVEARVSHEWRLVAPWWHWPLRAGADLDDRRSVRTSAPVLQKYDTPDLVNTFLADPQLRLRFQEDTDRVATVTPGTTPFNLPTRELTGTRKLFLGSHRRHYLVLCSLHCDRPGFPHVARSRVCHAGFVVRRRTLSVPPEEAASANETLKRFALARRRRAGAEAQLAAARQGGRVGRLREAALIKRVEALAAVQADAAGEVQRWAARVGVSRSLEGWVPRGVLADGSIGPAPTCPHPDSEVPRPAPLAGVGAWQQVSELPEVLEEASFPLYPLVPDPTRPQHDAAGETISFGVVPTGSSDVNPLGEARFDDHTAYEIRCFVRRHRPECPPEGTHCRCPIIWSEPSEPYQLASHFDLDGTANRPITVQMPDLAQLQADALRLGPGGTGGVRFQTPPGSALPFTAKGVEAENKGDESADFQICSFAIPLITIVAFFVLRLFLPIVVFVFQLWFLLLLKFCIPPDFELSAELSAALDALPPSLEIDASIAAEFLGGPLANQLREKLTEATQDYTGTDGATMTAQVEELRQTGELDDASYLALARGALATKATPPAGRVFAPRVTREQVVQP